MTCGHQVVQCRCKVTCQVVATPPTSLLKRFQDLNEAGLQLESLSKAMGMGAPALHMHAYEYDAEDFGLGLARDIDVGLLPAPDLHSLQDGSGRASTNLPALGPAVKAFKGWWTEEFTFRGFGIGFVKPIFRGMLIRPDIGVGIRYIDNPRACHSLPPALHSAGGLPNLFLASRLGHPTASLCESRLSFRT